MKKELIATMAGITLALTGCDVDQTQEAKLPNIEVDGKSGRMPDVDVVVKDKGALPSVDVDVKEKGQMPKFDVDVADVDVSVKEKEIKVPVPDVDITLPEDDGPAGKGDTDPEEE